MPRRSTSILFAAAMAVCSQIGPSCQSYEPPKVLSVSRADQLFFQTINKTTELAGLPQLRQTHVNNGDIEVRIWRGFGLGNLEGVVLRRTQGRWSGLHVITNDDNEPTTARVVVLPTPHSGWENLWNELTDKGILELALDAEKCRDEVMVDGVGDLVEVNQNQTYRNYLYQEGLDCVESRQIMSIAQTIGIEFDTGEQPCETAEWFPCAKIRRSRQLTSQ